jgi:hypothetical protein
MRKRLAIKEIGRRYEKVSQKESGGLRDILRNPEAMKGNLRLLRRRRGSIIGAKKRNTKEGKMMIGGEKKTLTRQRFEVYQSNLSKVIRLNRRPRYHDNHSTTVTRRQPPVRQSQSQSQIRSQTQNDLTVTKAQDQRLLNYKSQKLIAPSATFLLSHQFRRYVSSLPHLLELHVVSCILLSASHHIPLRTVQLHLFQNHPIGNIHFPNGL